MKLRQKKKNGLKQIVKREFGGNMTLRETSAVQEPVVVLCGTRRHDSHKPNHYTKLKCSNVNSNSHNKDTVFSEKISCVQQKKLSTPSKNTSKTFSRCNVHFTCIMEADVSSELLEISITIYDVTCRKQFFFSPPPEVTLKCTMTKETLRKVSARMGRNCEEIYLHVSVK